MVNRMFSHFWDKVLGVENTMSATKADSMRPLANSSNSGIDKFSLSFMRDSELTYGAHQILINFINS